MVLAVFAAFGSGISAEVKHIPHMGGPEVGTGEELLDQFLVVISLIFFGIVALGGVGGVPVQGFAAVLGAADGEAGVLGVELVEPGAVHGGVAAVPAEVVVIGDHIGDVDIALIHAAHGNTGHGGQTGLVPVVAEVVEDVVVFDPSTHGRAFP